MKFSIQKNIEFAEVTRTLPKRFRSLMKSGIPSDENCTVIVFGGNRVIRSKFVQSALEKLGPDFNPTILAFGYNFTDESRDLLQLHGAQIYTERDFYWTDTTYTKIRAHRSERKL